MKTKEFFSLTETKMKVGFFNTIEYAKTIIWYYPKWAFAQVDLYLLSRYLWKNPFKISKEFMAQRGEDDVHVYGETPLTTLDKIATECQLSTMDTVFELGCGRGRTCFWLNAFIGCRVVGVDFIPEFIQIAQEAEVRFDLHNVKFRLEDIVKTDLTGATVIYLYGTCLKDEEIRSLIQNFKKLHRGTKIITVSYSLKDYDPECPFEVIKRFPARFTWGETDVYMHM